MIVLVTLTLGLIWWMAAWAFGIKAFDAFLLTVAMVVGAAAYVIVKPFLDQLMGREPASFEERELAEEGLGRGVLLGRHQCAAPPPPRRAPPARSSCP